MDELLEFLASYKARVTYQDKWMIVYQKHEDKMLYTVYQKSYGKKNTVTLYEGNFLSSALLFLGENK